MRSTVTESINPIEKELVEATGFVPEKRYRKRQDFLGSLMRAVCDLSDQKFDELSDEAADWSCRAVDAFKAGSELPDFSETKEVEDSSSDEDINETVTSMPPDNDTSDEGGDRSAVEDQPSVEAVTADAPAEVQKKKPGRPKKKDAKDQKEPKTPKPRKAKTAQSSENQAPKVRHSGVNKWGVLIGSKSDIVCQMLSREEGATMEEIKIATGQYHYNLCNRLRRHGFNVEKNGLRIRLSDK